MSAAMAPTLKKWVSQPTDLHYYIGVIHRIILIHLQVRVTALLSSHQKILLLNPAVVTDGAIDANSYTTAAFIENRARKHGL
jgi:hypothetical protein